MRSRLGKDFEMVSIQFNSNSEICFLSFEINFHGISK